MRQIHYIEREDLNKRLKYCIRKYGNTPLSGDYIVERIYLVIDHNVSEFKKFELVNCVCKLRKRKNNSNRYMSLGRLYECLGFNPNISERLTTNFTWGYLYCNTLHFDINDDDTYNVTLLEQ